MVLHRAQEQAFGLPVSQLLPLPGSIAPPPLQSFRPAPCLLKLRSANQGSAQVKNWAKVLAMQNSGSHAIPRLAPLSGPFRSILDRDPRSRFRRSPAPVLGCRLTSITLLPSFFRSSSLCCAQICH